MSFNSSHKAYSTAIMEYEAARAFKKKASRSAVSAAKKASYNSTIAADKRLRPGLGNNFYTDTAKKSNSAIVRQSKKAIRAAVRDYKKRAEIQNFDSFESIESVRNAALFSIFGVGAAGQTQAYTSETSGMSRRQLMVGAGAIIAAAAMFSTPHQAHAGNASYISAVKQGVTNFSANKAPRVAAASAG